MACETEAMIYQTALAAETQAALNVVFSGNSLAAWQTTHTNNVAVLTAAQATRAAAQAAYQACMGG